ncbi:AmmeMemoRadiSam system protein A [Clostridium pascui]|uniref:AmmeMemoRadiSam system protein A n=1 Tax=Clostridium pascui TaxID=46609 RepID=UPI001958F04F|nr:AmmeMemoRadiSam system protein A [Clostridium pascui]MBM7871165.1 AmmeMemoRadiSam system protein A [Clostridium pascui]
MGKILSHYIMPHPPIAVAEVGKGEEKKIQKTIDACIEISKDIEEKKPETIIIITPHGPLFRDAVAIMSSERIEGDFRNFNAPNVSFQLNIDGEISNNLLKNLAHEDIMAVGIDETNSRLYDIELELDHGVMVPLYFINKNYKNYKLVHITYGLLSSEELYKVGKIIKSTVESSSIDVVLIASGDLSHKLSEESPYGYAKEGPEFDDKITTLLESGDVKEIFNLNGNMCEVAGECGLRSFYILLGTLYDKKIQGKLLSYEGPFGIGYGVMKMETVGDEETDILKELETKKEEKLKKIRDRESEYVKLARKSIEGYIRNKKYIEIAEDLPEEMLKEKRGVFVSLKKNGDLRGCIGTTAPTTNNVAEEIIKNAVEAAVGDPRFAPVEEKELDEIIYSVDVLMPAEDTKREDLDPKKYGVIVTSGYKGALLLPDLEGIDTVEEQLDVVLRKAGINSGEQYSLQRFEVLRYR